VLNASKPVPSGLMHPTFNAAPLTVANANLDYAAYMASPEVIRTHSAGRWPVEGLTVEEDRELIATHQADHEAWRAFAFTLLNPDGDQGVGCLYLNPLHAYLARVGADRATRDRFPVASALVTFWIRQDRQQTELPRAVVAAVNAWIVAAWPLDAHLFRILPDEHSSRAALERAGLRPVALVLPGEMLPYLWYGPLRDGERGKRG
jgi:RimJ/RimL family protein N-acetyltransferase